MIYVTVGTQLSFDRLIGAVHSFSKSKPDIEIFAQTGKTDLLLDAFPNKAFVTPQENSRLVQKASLIIGHAGMGTVITALDFGKPVIVMPRMPEFGEHRNAHQVSTAQWLEELSGVYVAWNEDSLLNHLHKHIEIIQSEKVGMLNRVDSDLLEFINDFIDKS